MALLAVDLKEGTKSVHAEAERSKFVRYFFKGEISAATYGRFLISLYQVYSALEKALDAHKDNASLQLIYFPRCAATKPELLLAHSYVRYLGDLSGGQILAKKLQKYNDLPEGKGVAFYHFDLIEDKEGFKDQFRKRLNQVEVDEETHRQIVEESCQAFIRNIDIFQEFDHELVGLPLSKKEQEALEAQAATQAEEAAVSSGFLSSFTPTNLMNSLANAVGFKPTA
ncbi:hypothetical protein BGZ52_005775 [Haplosporangium bisporale]|nr:hypothetical protein BGZ52_005775 [Haplosporangium bisporale]